MDEIEHDNKELVEDGDLDHAGDDNNDAAEDGGVDG